MQINRRTLVGAGAAIAGVAAAESAQASRRQAGGGAGHARAVRLIEDYADRHRRDWGIPGMIVSVVGKDGFEAQVFSGHADVGRRAPVGADHLFQIGSVSKMIAALTLWAQIDEGKLAPDQKLSRLMPELQVKDGDAITLQHLLDHTSGLPRGASPFLDGGLWTGFAPGSQWAYSNLAYQIAGMIAGRTDGTSFQDAAERRVLRPLKMNASKGAIRAGDRALYARGYEPARLDGPSIRPGPMVEAPWVDYDRASGCIAATAGDMALFLRFLLGLASGDGGPVFSDGTAQRFLADPAAAPGWSAGAKYGNGVAHVAIDGRDYLYHTGGMVSFTSSLHVDPAAGVAAFASANVHYATAHRPRNVSHYACEIIRAVQDGAPAPAPKATKPVLEDPGLYAGSYVAKNSETIEIATADAAIILKRNGRASVLQPVGGGLFACADPAFEISGLQFETENKRVVRIWAGATEYLPDPEAGFKEHSSDIAPLAGVYIGESRWDTPTSIYSRGDKLFAVGGNYSRTLVRDEAGRWYSGKLETATDRTAFDSVVDGKPQRIVTSGEAQFRKDA